MTNFKAKMHQIPFRLGLCPDPAGELTALPRPLAGFGGPLRGRGGAGLGNGRGRGGRRKWRGGRGMAPSYC